MAVTSHSSMAVNCSSALRAPVPRTKAPHKISNASFYFSQSKSIEFSRDRIFSETRIGLMLIATENPPYVSSFASVVRTKRNGPTPMNGSLSVLRLAA